MAANSISLGETLAPTVALQRCRLDLHHLEYHLALMKKPDKQVAQLIKTWVLPPSSTLGSAVRIKGIFQEIKARLSPLTKKAVELDGNEIILVLPASEKLLFNAASATISDCLTQSQNFPIIPREIEDILGIKTSERKRWLEDGRLPSAGTKTVRLRGRAKKITFHVFDPATIADIHDRGLVDQWREDDLIAAAEKRREAAYKAKLTRSLRKPTKTKPDTVAETGLQDLDVFFLDGLLK